MRRGRRSYTPLAILVTGIAAGVLGVGTAGDATGLALAAKSTVFHGRIHSATKIYARLRGAVRLILTSSGGPTPDPILGIPSYSLTVAVRGSKCIHGAPGRCVTLTGTLSGVGNVNGASAYEVGPLQGRVSRLGELNAAGGLIEREGPAGRRRLFFVLVMEGKRGSIDIHAISPIVPEASSPF